MEPQDACPALQRLASQSKVSLELICDLNIERARSLCKSFGYQVASDDIQQAIHQAAPDAIVCTVQPTATFALVQSLLPLRVPLMIEKPPGTSLSEAMALANAAASAQTFTFVAFNRRHIPSIIRLKQWAADKSVRYAHAEMLRTKRLEINFALETGIHALDALRFLLGQPTAIEVRSLRHLSSEAQDRWVRLLFANGAVAELSMLLNSGMRRERYLLTEEGSTMEISLGAAYSSAIDVQADRVWQHEELVEGQSLTGDPLIDSGILGEYEEFLQLVHKGSPSTCSLADAAYSMQLAEAVQNNYSGPLPPLVFD